MALRLLQTVCTPTMETRMLFRGYKIQFTFYTEGGSATLQQNDVVFLSLSLSVT